MKPKEKEKKRDIEIKIRLNEDERKKIAHLNSANLREAIFIRETVLNTSGKRFAKKKIDPSLARELARVGNNLNQIAKRLHVADEINSAAQKDLYLILIDTQRQITEIRESVQS